jgi:hypothetical protein
MFHLYILITYYVYYNIHANLLFLQAKYNTFICLRHLQRTESVNY